MSQRILPRCIAFLSQKGGTAKTTSCVNTAAALGKLGKKVLVIDMDPKGHSTIWLNALKYKGRLSRLLSGKEKIEDVIVPTEWSNVYIIAGGAPTAAIEYQMTVDNGLVLREEIKKLLGYDYIIFDCSNGLGKMVTATLLCAREVVIPVELRYFAMRGADQMLGIIKQIQLRSNPDLKLLGFLLIGYNKLSAEGKLILDSMNLLPQRYVFETVIPQSAQLSLSSKRLQPAIYFSPNDKGALAYMSFAKELERFDGSGRTLSSETFPYLSQL